MLILIPCGETGVVYCTALEVSDNMNAVSR